MGEVDIERQKLNVFRMNLLGAEVRSVSSGSKTLKDATNEAIRDWVTNVNDTHYIIGSVVGPHPYPMIVRDFQSIIGSETKVQILEIEKKLPNYNHYYWNRNKTRQHSSLREVDQGTYRQVRYPSQLIW